MRKMKPLRLILLLLGVVTLVVIAATLTALSFAKVEMTENGVHTRLLVPIGSKAIGLPNYAGTGEHVVLRNFLDGPVVHRLADGGWSASWFCEDHVEHARGTSEALQIQCAGQTHTFALDSAPIAPAVAPMPEQLVVLSDLEGNIRFLDAALAKLGVMDADGMWTYGRGQLVVLGDSVDRGRDVSAVLWRLHGLALEARAAGGAVRMVLGNHEQYVLSGNISRTHPEHRYALREMGGVSSAYASDTVLGAWLRAQPVALKLGRILFVHAGVSPKIADAGLSVDELNDAMRGYWQTPAGTATRSSALDAVIGNSGVTHYRGYFRERKGFYSAATATDVDRGLQHFGVDQVVVAHTLVDQVKLLHDGHVYAVDVNDDEARPDVLVYNQGVPTVVDMGVSRALATDSPSKTREFNLLQSKDRHLLGAMSAAYRELSEVPQPY